MIYPRVIFKSLKGQDKSQDMNGLIKGISLQFKVQENLTTEIHQLNPQQWEILSRQPAIFGNEFDWLPTNTTTPSAWHYKIYAISVEDIKG